MPKHQLYYERSFTGLSIVFEKIGKYFDKIGRHFEKLEITFENA